MNSNEPTPSDNPTRDTPTRDTRSGNTDTGNTGTGNTGTGNTGTGKTGTGKTGTGDAWATDYRRNLVLVLSVVLLSICGWVLWRYENTGTVKMVASATGRIGLVLGALWLAWPSLTKPANWLPPGFAVLGVMVLAIIAAQPRTIVILAPAFAGLLALASFVRAMRG